MFFRRVGLSQKELLLFCTTMKEIIPKCFDGKIIRLFYSNPQKKKTKHNKRKIVAKTLGIFYNKPSFQ